MNTMWMQKRHGFTLIEVLVTLVILMFGMLGLAGLVMKGHHANFEAYQRNQALTIANDLAERLKANQITPSGTFTNTSTAAAYVLGAPLLTPLGGPASTKYKALFVDHTTPDCRAVTCTRAQMVEYDLGLWEAELLGGNEARADGATVGGIISARGCVEGPLAAPSAPGTYRVSIAWQGNVPTAVPPSSACGLGLYKDDSPAVNDRTRRLVSVDVTISLP